MSSDESFKRVVERGMRVYREDTDIPALTPDSRWLRDNVQDKGCRRCPLGSTSAHACQFGEGPAPALGMVVTDAPNRRETELERPLLGDVGRYFLYMLDQAGVNPESVYVTHAVKCQAPYKNTQNELLKSLKECGNYLAAEIVAVKPTAILAMGAVPFKYFSGTTGITTQRGKIFDWEKLGDHITIVPTLSPAYVLQNPAYHTLFLADLAKFRRAMLQQTLEPAVNIDTVWTLEDVKRMEADLGPYDGVITFDLETRGFVDSLPEYSKVWCVALTRGEQTETGMRVYNVPLEHPEAPWNEEQRREVVTAVCGLLFSSKVNGHNVKFDVRHLTRLAERYGLR